MTRKIVKLILVLVMLAGIGFSVFNLLTVKAEAEVYWQKLEMGTDPITGGTYIRCWSTGQSCVTVEQPA